jgi:hypothetical protein
MDFKINGIILSKPTQYGKTYSKADYMMVLEDDCRPYKNFMQNFKAVIQADLGFDIFWLYNGNWTRNKHPRNE